MKTNLRNFYKYVLGAASIFLISGAQAAILNNTVSVSGMSMDWSHELSTVSTTTQDGDVTTFMGSDSVTMMVDGVPMPVWDYSWNFSADADPFIAGSFTVTNTSSMMQTFDLLFSLPVSPSFTDGYMTGSLSGSYTDADGSGSAALNLNAWEGLIDGSVEMNGLFSFAGPCLGVGCSVNIAPVTQGPDFYSGDVNSTIGIHMNFGLSAGDSVTFDTLFDVTPVPVPAAVWLFGSGLIALAGFVRRKQI